MNKIWELPVFLVPLFAFLIFSLEAFIPLEHIQTGENLYKLYCASCHGVSGDGTGDLAYLVYPKPRDFTGGKFKIKSTLPGLPPTDDDLFKTIRQGMPGTAMPAFNFLKDDEIKSLEKNIIKSELRRVFDFADTALNKYDALDSLSGTLDLYDIDIYDVKGKELEI